MKTPLTQEDVKRWATNILAFSAPALAIFFYQLSIGVEPKAAAPIALFAFYGALADLFKKYRQATKED